VSELARSPGDPHRWTDLARNPDDERVPGIVVLRVEAGLFFANADYVRTGVRQAAARKGTRAVVLDAQTVAFIDVTAADMLATLSEELARLASRWWSRTTSARCATHCARRPRDSIGSRTYATVDAAIEALHWPGRFETPAG
jgi:MFS superfamily sulfate permease-like transporter